MGQTNRRDTPKLYQTSARRRTPDEADERIAALVTNAGHSQLIWEFGSTSATASKAVRMTFTAAAWIAATAGALTGVLTARFGKPAVTSLPPSVTQVVGALIGAAVASLAFGFFSILEGWAAFFHRQASPTVPLLFTIGMLAACVGAVWLARRIRR
jgi:hypothetical protein